MRSPARHRRARTPRLAAALAVVGLAVAGTAATGSHTVGAGDTLSELAADHGVSVAELAEANGIDDPDRIIAGTELVIPGVDAKRDDADEAKGRRKKDGEGTGEELGADAPIAEAGGGAGGAVHTVAPGESLSTIADRYGVSVRALAEANGIGDIHRIQVGQRLVVPGSVADPRERPHPGAVDTSRFPALLQASPKRLALVPVFERWAGASGVPLDLLMAMTWLESGWQDDVVSSAGAIGVGQLMPDTARWMSETVLRVPLDPYDADDNIRMSAAYLRWLLDRTDGDPATALAGYYQGLGAVRSAGVFPSTRVYVADVLAFRDRHF